MKALKAFMVALFVMGSFSLFAQSNSKVIAVVNKADWCGTCEKHGERAMTKVFSEYNEPQVTLIYNDLTDDKSKAESKKVLEELGVYDLMAEENKTGILILIDNKTKKIISKTSLAKSTEELKGAFNKAIKES